MNASKLAMALRLAAEALEEVPGQKRVRRPPTRTLPDVVLTDEELAQAKKVLRQSGFRLND